ncbi:unnamed protein product [Arctogadus glacialis]
MNRPADSSIASSGKPRLSRYRREDLDTPVLTVHQTISDVRGSYYQEKTVFLRCTVNSNPPARFIWKRGNAPIEQSKDNGVDIYEPLYTQGETKVLKLKNLRLKDFANYTCQVSVRNVCSIEDKSVTFRLTNGTRRAVELAPNMVVSSREVRPKGGVAGGSVRHCSGWRLLQTCCTKDPYR